VLDREVKSPFASVCSLDFEEFFPRGRITLWCSFGFHIDSFMPDYNKAYSYII